MTVIKNFKLFFIIFFLIVVTMITVMIFSYMTPLSSTLLKYQNFNSRVNSVNSDTYIIFIKGLGTKCDGTRFNNMDFSYLRKRLDSAGFDYKDNRFIQYSYNGGQIRNGNWYPDKYNSMDTGQPIEISVKKLSNLINNLSRKNPSARFLLVGHSMGGVIAFNYLSKNIDNNMIRGIITLNAPLTGSIYNIPEPVLDFCKNKNLIWGSTAVRQMVLMHRAKEEILEWRESVAQRAQKNGIHIATFATYQDIIVLPRSAYLLNQHNESIADGYIFSVNPFERLPESICAHKQILDREYVADYILNILKKTK